MKVFLVMYWNYDDTNFCGVFSSAEKAQIYINSRVWDHNENIVRRYGPGQPRDMFDNTDHYSIEELEVQ